MGVVVFAVTALFSLYRMATISQMAINAITGGFVGYVIGSLGAVLIFDDNATENKKSKNRADKS